jgi:protease secretion system membrane fusion protein
MVQHPNGGVIKEMLVREGQRVEEDQPLMQLEDTAVRANYEAIRQRYLALRAMESRLLSEQAGRTQVDFHPDVTAQKTDPLIARHMLNQQQLLTTRRSGLASDLAILEENIRGQEALVQSYGGMLESRQSQRRLLSEQLQHIRDLVKDGYAPRNQQLDLERAVADVSALITELQGNTIRARQAIAELRQRALSRQQDYRKEIETMLADVSREVQSDEGRLNAARGELERTVIRAPAAGQVIGLTYQTVGGVIPAGQRLMEVVPGDEALLLEAQIAPHLIDRVSPGLLTDVRFSTFAHSPTLVVKGEVQSVSADLLTEQTASGPMSFYLARVRITPEGMKELGRHQIQPGMPAEVIIKTGERTVLTYMLHPLTRRVAASMKEQ